MKRKSHEWFGTLFLALWMTACSGPMVRTQYDHSAHFSDFHTYGWLATAGHLGKNAPRDPSIDKRIRSAIDDTLQSKGFRAVSEKEADVLLDYSVTSEEKVNARLENYETAEFMGITYILGTLSLTMTRGEPPAVVWSGTAQANIDMSRPLEERDKKLHAAVQKLLEKFPPVTVAAPHAN